MSKSGGDGLNHFNGGGEAKYLCRSGTSYSTAAATESAASQVQRVFRRNNRNVYKRETSLTILFLVRMTIDLP